MDDSDDSRHNIVKFAFTIGKAKLTHWHRRARRNLISLTVYTLQRLSCLHICCDRLKYWTTQVLISVCNLKIVKKHTNWSKTNVTIWLISLGTVFDKCSLLIFQFYFCYKKASFVCLILINTTVLSNIKPMSLKAYVLEQIMCKVGFDWVKWFLINLLFVMCECECHELGTVSYKLTIFSSLWINLTIPSWMHESLLNGNYYFSFLKVFYLITAATSFTHLFG